MAVSKKAAPSKAAPKADAGHSHNELNAKIASLEKKVAELENQLGGLGDAVESLTNSYNAGKEKLVSEVNELKENAKSWATKKKEAMDTNNDGKVDLEEVYRYVYTRLRSRMSAPKKKK